MCDITWSDDHRTIYANFVADDTETAQQCVEQLASYMKQVLDNGNMFTMRVDTTRMRASPGFGSVKSLIRFMKEYRPKCAAQMKGSAILLQNPVLRWLVNTMFAIHPPTSPVTLVSSLAEADQYIKNAIDGEVSKNQAYVYERNEDQERMLTAEERELCAS